MAKRTRAEAAATRESLLDAAERVFRAKGVARTTLADVAKAAGVTRGAVYWHFRDKADLFDAMCGRAVLPLEGILEQASRAGIADPLATLRALCLESLTRLGTDARTCAVFDVMFHRCELGGEAAAARLRREAVERDCLHPIEGVIRQAVERRQLPADTDTALAAEATHAYMVGLMHQWVLDPGAYDLARAAPALVDTWLAGLATRPPRRARSRHVRGRSRPTRSPRAAPTH